MEDWSALDIRAQLLGESPGWGHAGRELDVLGFVPKLVVKCLIRVLVVKLADVGLYAAYEENPALSRDDDALTQYDHAAKPPQYDAEKPLDALELALEQLREDALYVNANAREHAPLGERVHVLKRSLASFAGSECSLALVGKLLVMIELPLWL